MSQLSPLMQETIAQISTTNVRLQNILLTSYRQCVPGSGVDFDELQSYRPGDDIHTIDWKSSARSNEVFVKHYVESFDNNILMAVDTSSSMNFIDAAGELKLKKIIGSMFLLARTALINGDRVGFMYRSHGRYIKKPFTRLQSAIVPELNNLEFVIKNSYLEENDWTGFFDYLTNRVKEHCICFIVSDDLDFKLSTISKLKLASLKHTLIFIEISNWLDDVDSYDVNPLLTDIETGEPADWFLDQTALIGQFKKELKLASESAHIRVTIPARHIRLSDSRPVIYDMIRLLSAQQRTLTKKIST